MKVTFELTVDEFKQLFGTSNETELHPNWNNAPEWAKYWAVDKDGEAYFYEQSPYPEDWQWEYRDEDGQIGHDKNFYKYGIDWKTTLRKRPR